MPEMTDSRRPTLLDSAGLPPAPAGSCSRTRRLPSFVRGVRAVAAGEPMLSPAVTRRLIGHVTGSDWDDRRRHAREQLDLLTEREREVAIAIGLGKPNAEIGRELFMSVAAVKAHVSRVLEKLALNNRVQIALLAHDAGRV